MARVVYGALVTELHGAIGGTVFQGSSKGNVARNKGMQGLTLATRQELMKRNLLKCSQFWSNMASSKRTGYNTFATTYPQYDKKTGSRQLAGYEVFLLWNLDRLARGIPIEDDVALAGITLPSVAPELANTGGILLIQLHESGTEPDAGFAYFMSRPLASGITNPGSRLRYVYSVGTDAGAVDITNQYLAALGALPVNGNTVFVDVKPFGIIDPFVFARQRFKLVVE